MSFDGIRRMEEGKPEIVRKQYTFTGRVQGVGFRYSAQYLAQGLGVTGWVKNEWNGTVIMEAQGEKEQLDRLVSCSGKGALSALTMWRSLQFLYSQNWDFTYVNIVGMMVLLLLHHTCNG